MRRLNPELKPLFTALTGLLPWLLVGLALAAPVAAVAAELGSRNLPIELNADQAEMDGRTGVGVYTGNVIMTQGERRITGDRMTVHTVNGRELDYVEVDGQPATWRTLPEGGGEVVRGQAPRLEYHTRGPERVLMLQGGRVEQGRNVFTGETMEYNLENERMKASGRDQDERIRITLFPEEDGQE